MKTNVIGRDLTFITRKKLSAVYSSVRLLGDKESFAFYFKSFYYVRKLSMLLYIVMFIKFWLLFDDF